MRTIVNILNEALKLDRVAIQSLIEHRVPCSKKLADHPNIIVQDAYTVGALGVINGICDSLTGQRIVAIYENDQIVEFRQHDY